MSGLVDQGHVHGKVIAFAQEIVQVVGATQELRLDFVDDSLIDVPDVDCSHAHTEGLRPQRQLLAAGAKSDNR